MKEVTYKHLYFLNLAMEKLCVLLLVGKSLIDLIFQLFECIIVDLNCRVCSLWWTLALHLCLKLFHLYFKFLNRFLSLLHIFIYSIDLHLNLLTDDSTLVAIFF